MTASAALFLACFFAACFAHDIWKGKTITFPFATIEREDNPIGFWLMEGYTALLAVLCAYHGVVLIWRS